MLIPRIMAMKKEAGSQADMGKILKRASKEVVIRFGLSKSISSRAASDADYPELNDININADSEDAKKSKLLLAGFSYMASQNKTGTSLQASDIENVVKAFADDFGDGKFDGKDSTGKEVTIGPNGKPLGADALSKQLMAAVQAFIKEGGQINGLSSLSTADLSNIQFNDAGTIAYTESLIAGEPAPPAPVIVLPSVIYPQSSYTFTNGMAILTVTPNVTGNISSCSITPNLPTGLSFNTTTCQITGTPTVNSNASSYTIKATNTEGSTSVSLTISVNSNPPSVSFTPTSFTPSVGFPFSITPSLTGSVTGCAVSPALPSGVTINTSSCAISGTASSTQTGTYTITPSNTFGSGTPFTISLTIVNNAPSVSNISISGTLAISQVLSPSYTFSDPDGHAQGSTTFQWQRCTTTLAGSCTNIAGATATNYTIQQADDGNYIRVVITPKDSFGLNGTAVISNPTAQVDLAPTLTTNYIRSTSVSSNSVTLAWTGANDAVTSSSNLQYLLYYSMSPNINTVALAEANGTPVGAYTTNTLTNTVSGLTAETMYFFNVIVKDSAGNKTSYLQKKEFPSASLYLYLPFDGDAKNKAASTGSSLDATAYGGTSYGSDMNGSANAALNFNGSTTAYVQIPTMNIPLGSGYTIFLRAAHTGFNNYSRLVDFGNGQASDNILFTNISTTSGITYETYIGGTTTNLQGINFNSSTWDVYAITQATNGVTRIYRNGVEILNGTLNYPSTMNRTSNFIGKSNWGVDGYLSGWVDDFRIYSRVLSPTEIGNLQ